MLKANRKLLMQGTPQGLLAAVTIVLSTGGPILAQGGSPLPGADTSSSQQASSAPTGGAYSSPLPGQSQPVYNSAPVPGESASPPRAAVQRAPAQRIKAGNLAKPVIANPFAARESFYKQLPLTVADAENKIKQLTQRLATFPPSAVKDGIFNMCEWMQDCADAHWKMYKAFDKQAATKAQANQEKETALKFSRLKNKARLLKADLFIKQNRYPEALGPLVDIVVAEPSTTTGKEAYKRLIDMGFSEQASSLVASGDEKEKN